MGRYLNRVAIVTGGASGIGRAICEAMAAEGATVVVADIAAELAEQTAAKIRSTGGRAEAAKLDVTDAAAVAELIESTAKKHGALDYLFNNAGIAIVGEARHHSLADWTLTLDVNLRGVIHGVHAAYQVMLRQGHGHIVNVASVAGLIPAANEIAYAASKHAVVGLSTTLRAEGADLGVKVSVVCPGFIDTPILEQNLRFAEHSPVQSMSRDKIRELFKVRFKPPAEAAREILHAVDRNQAVIVLTPHAKLFGWMQRLVPNSFLKLQRKTVAIYRAKVLAPAEAERRGGA